MSQYWLMWDTHRELYFLPMFQASVIFQLLPQGLYPKIPKIDCSLNAPTALHKSLQKFVNNTQVRMCTQPLRGVVCLSLCDVTKTLPRISSNPNFAFIFDFNTSLGLSNWAYFDLQRITLILQFTCILWKSNNNLTALNYTSMVNAVVTTSQANKI